MSEDITIEEVPITLKIDDVYRFRYNAAERERLGYSASHCFEGMLCVRETPEGLILVDTYWGINGNLGRRLTLEKALKLGELTFSFNFNEVEPIREDDQVYYNDDDLFTVSEQHACVPRCVHWYKRKDAIRSKSKMLRIIDEHAQNSHREVE